MLVAALGASLIIAGCGDDEPASDTQAFCDFMARGHATGAPPDADGFQEMEALAPDEIRRDVNAAARMFRQQGPDAFDDPEFRRIELAIEEWEAESCHDARGSE